MRIMLLLVVVAADYQLIYLSILERDPSPYIASKCTCSPTNTLYVCSAIGPHINMDIIAIYLILIQHVQQSML